MTSSTASCGIAAKVRSSVAAAWRAGMTTITLASARSATARLDVDGARAPERHLDPGAGQCDGKQQDARGDGRGRLPAGERSAAGIRPAQCLVEVQPAGQRPDEPVEPADHDLPSTQARD